MAQGPEANLWRNMRQNLPEGALAERIENRHGGGMSDIMMVWNLIIFLIELKAPKTLPKKWFADASFCDHKENPAAGSGSSPAGNTVAQIEAPTQYSEVKNINIEAARLLSPEQIAFHSRVIRASGLSFVLARPQDTKILELFTPVLGPAAFVLSPAAPDQGPGSEGMFHVKQALRLPAEGPALRLARIGGFSGWPPLFAALRARACDHIRGVL